MAMLSPILISRAGSGDLIETRKFPPVGSNLAMVPTVSMSPVNMRRPLLF
jgi:hypothetical protein